MVKGGITSRMGARVASGSLIKIPKAAGHNAESRSPEQFTERLDELIKEIREVHRPNMHGEKACNVLLVSWPDEQSMNRIACECTKFLNSHR